MVPGKNPLATSWPLNGWNAETHDPLPPNPLPRVPQVPPVPAPGVQRATWLADKPPAVTKSPPTTKSTPKECSALTLGVPPPVPLPRAAQVDPSNRAILVAVIWPAVAKNPPTYSMPLLWTLSAWTVWALLNASPTPPTIVFQADPFHLAMLGAKKPPALRKCPPAINSPLNTVSA